MMSGDFGSSSTPTTTTGSEMSDDGLLSEQFGRRLAIRLSGSFEQEDEEDIHRHRNAPTASAGSSSSTLKNPAEHRWNDTTIDSRSIRRSGYRLAFEIISAKTKVSGKSRYIAYSILIKRAPGLEVQPGLIERRFSDFFCLYLALKKRFPSLMNDFPFPRKLILGNFSAEVITERSHAFQHLLTYCLSVHELRQTPEFADFLYTLELREAIRLVRAEQFEEAAGIAENSYFIQDKLHGYDGGLSLFSCRIFRTLCIIVACHFAVSNFADALCYANKAIQLITAAGEPAGGKEPLAVAMLVTALKALDRLQRPASSSGADLQQQQRSNRAELERMLQCYRRYINVDKQPSLLEFVKQKDFLTNCQR